MLKPQMPNKLINKFKKYEMDVLLVLSGVLSLSLIYFFVQFTSYKSQTIILSDNLKKTEKEYTVLKNQDRGLEIDNKHMNKYL